MSEPLRAFDGDQVWDIPDWVAWIDSGERLLVLDVRAPYDAMPWLLPDSAAQIWRAIARGYSRDRIVAEVLSEVPDPAMPGQVTGFIAELLRRGLIGPAATPDTPARGG